MKTRIVAGLAVLSLSLAAQAQEQAPGMAADSTTNVAAPADEQQADKIQYRTYDQGAQLLDVISTQVNDDLEARMANDVGTEVTTKLVTSRMLVSKN